MDDFATWRGRRYGTVLVDLTTHRLHVMAVKCTEAVLTMTECEPGQVPAEDLIAPVSAEQWLRANADDGSKGRRMYDWTRVGLWRRGWPGNVGSDCWLVGQRPHRACVLRLLRAGRHPLAMLVRIAGRSWMVEEAFEQAKGEVGLDAHQVRQYPAWYRHVALATVAYAFLAVTRAADVGAVVVTALGVLVTLV